MFRFLLAVTAAVVLLSLTPLAVVADTVIELAGFFAPVKGK